MTDDIAVFKVIVNHEEHYSICPNEKDIPSGWRAEGKI